MTSLGRVQGAIASLSQETTVALANLNFDFSIVKVEAPTEYQELGRALSARRRTAAEQGSSHRTAQKLGALFKDIIPATPNLFRAYGLRASEIAQSSAVNPRSDTSFGPFSEHIGVDGTSIWAAATSGNAAVAIHLLACMLARIWSAAEAISIWEQLVGSRKQELSVWDESGVISIQNLNASQIEISREKLAEWDASARAWLRAADIAKKLNQKQFLLIVENVNLPVSKGMDIYENVMLAWTTALSSIDKLVHGSSLSVHNGAVLLGLSAWHLYPDLNVTGSVTATVRQQDPLMIPGVIATIGLHDESLENGSGIYWSLPLAHVRHYGDVVISERHVNSEQSRNSIEDLWQVYLGSLLRLWGEGVMKRDKVLELITFMWQLCENEITATKISTSSTTMWRESWLSLLADAANRYLYSKSDEQTMCKRLFGLGQRSFALHGSEKRTEPIFGLTDTLLLKMIKPEKRIDYLRHIARSFQNPKDVFVIKMCEKRGNELVTLQLATAFDHNSEDQTSAVDSSRRYARRWIYKSNVHVHPPKIPVLMEEENGEEFYSLDPDSIASAREGKWFRWGDPPLDFLEHASIYGKETTPGNHKHKHRSFILRKTQNEAARPVATFEYVFGDIRSAALFRRKTLDNVSFRKIEKEEVDYQPRVTLENISDAFIKNMVAANYFLEYLCGYKAEEMPESPRGCSTKVANSSASRPLSCDSNCSAIETLRALATVTKLYSGMPNTTVSLEIVNFGAIKNAKWMTKTRNAQNSKKNLFHKESANLLMPYSLSRPCAFACIAMFESGSFDLHPDVLETVLAIASGDSIFVAAAILNDPVIDGHPQDIQRIVGNIGRAGIAFLIPPRSPRRKQLALDCYRVINHEPYDGQLEDAFQSTTLHLGFSGYEMPLNVGDHGAVHCEAFFLETLVRVHDRGAWIADLDILKSLDSPHFAKISAEIAASCHHRDDECARSPNFDLVTIDRWEELLERPHHAGVVRAYGNWLARLAAMAVSVEMGNYTILCSRIDCWRCIEETCGLCTREGPGDDHEEAIIIC